MSLEKLLEIIKANGKHNYIYHFTDNRNIPTIREYGLLSKSEMRKEGIWPPAAPSGNQWSWEADDHKGVSDYVSLCMTQNHPMCFIASKEQRIKSWTYLHIDPEIILEEGVLFAKDVANKKMVQLTPIKDSVDYIDCEVLYSNTDWTDPEIKERLKSAEKYEILIPKAVKIERILKGL